MNQDGFESDDGANGIIHAIYKLGGLSVVNVLTQFNYLIISCRRDNESFEN